MNRFSIGSAFKFQGRKFYGPLRGFQGKPFHPPLTDIPVGAYVIAPILDAIAFAGRSATWGHDMFLAAGYTLLAGAAFSVITALTGVADWTKTKPGTEVRRMANTHGLTMVVMTLLVLANLAFRFLGDLQATSAALLALSGAIFGLVLFGGAIGGALVYDRGMRVVAEEESPSSQPMRRAG
jgi:uncharacterized membrane protein